MVSRIGAGSTHFWIGHPLYGALGWVPGVSGLASKSRGGLGWGGAVLDFTGVGWEDLGRGSPPLGSGNVCLGFFKLGASVKRWIMLPWGGCCNCFTQAQSGLSHLLAVQCIVLSSHRPYLASVFRLRVASLELSLALCAVGSLCPLRVGCASAGCWLRCCFAFVPRGPFCVLDSVRDPGCLFWLVTGLPLGVVNFTTPWSARGCAVRRL